MKPPSSQETLVWGFITFTGALCLVQGLVPRTCLITCALTGLFVEDVVQGARWSPQHVANAFASVSVQVSVRATVLFKATYALTAFHIQLLICATEVWWEDVCRDAKRDTNNSIRFWFSFITANIHILNLKAWKNSWHFKGNVRKTFLKGPSNVVCLEVSTPVGYSGVIRDFLL